MRSSSRGALEYRTIKFFHNIFKLIDENNFMRQTIYEGPIRNATWRNHRSPVGFSNIMETLDGVVWTSQSIETSRHGREDNKDIDLHERRKVDDVVISYSFYGEITTKKNSRDGIRERYTGEVFFYLESEDEGRMAEIERTIRECIRTKEYCRY